MFATNPVLIKWSIWGSNVYAPELWSKSYPDDNRGYILAEGLWERQLFGEGIWSELRIEPADADLWGEGIWANMWGEGIWSDVPVQPPPPFYKDFRTLGRINRTFRVSGEIGNGRNN